MPEKLSSGESAGVDEKNSEVDETTRGGPKGSVRAKVQKWMRKVQKLVRQLSFFRRGQTVPPDTILLPRDWVLVHGLGSKSTEKSKKMPLITGGCNKTPVFLSVFFEQSHEIWLDLSQSVEVIISRAVAFKSNEKIQKLPRHPEVLEKFTFLRSQESVLLLTQQVLSRRQQAGAGPDNPVRTPGLRHASKTIPAAHAQSEIWRKRHDC